MMASPSWKTCIRIANTVIGLGRIPFSRTILIGNRSPTRGNTTSRVAGFGIWNQISSTLTISTNDLPETARAAAFQDSVERLTALDLACRNAREAFAIALAQDATACDTYMAWESQHQAEWEDYEAARSDYQRDCGPMCPGLFVSYGYQLVPRPEGKTNRASCET